MSNGPVWIPRGEVVRNSYKPRANPSNGGRIVTLDVSRRLPRVWDCKLLTRKVLATEQSAKCQTAMACKFEHNRSKRVGLILATHREANHSWRRIKGVYRNALVAGLSVDMVDLRTAAAQSFGYRALLDMPAFMRLYSKMTFSVSATNLVIEH